MKFIEIDFVTRIYLNDLIEVLRPILSKLIQLRYLWIRTNK